MTNDGDTKAAIERVRQELGDSPAVRSCNCANGDAAMDGPFEGHNDYCIWNKQTAVHDAAKHALDLITTTLSEQEARIAEWKRKWEMEFNTYMACDKEKHRLEHENAEQEAELEGYKEALERIASGRVYPMTVVARNALTQDSPEEAT